MYGISASLAFFIQQTIREMVILHENDKGKKKKRESTGELILPFSVSSVSPFNSALKLCNAVYATTFIRKQILRQRCADVWRDPSFPNVSTFLVLDLTCTLCLWNILATKQISPKRTALSVGRNVRYPHALYPTSQKFLRFCS